MATLPGPGEDQSDQEEQAGSERTPTDQEPAPKAKKSKKKKNSSEKSAGKQKVENVEGLSAKPLASDDEHSQKRDPLKFVNLNRASSLKKKKSLSRKGSQSSRKSGSSDGSERAHESDSEIFPPPGVALKRWISQASVFSKEKKKWVFLFFFFSFSLLLDFFICVRELEPLT